MNAIMDTVDAENQVELEKEIRFYIYFCGRIDSSYIWIIYALDILPEKCSAPVWYVIGTQELLLVFSFIYP